MSGGNPFFEENNFKPTDSVRQRIRIRNRRNDKCNLTLNTNNEKQNPANLAAQFNTAITSDGQDLYGRTLRGKAASNEKTLQDVFEEDNINLISIDKKSSKNIDWIVTLNPNTGNQFQNANLIFDFDSTFICDSNQANTATETNTAEGQILGTSDKQPSQINLSNLLVNTTEIIIAGGYNNLFEYGLWKILEIAFNLL